jgi:hypothetical protein
MRDAKAKLERMFREISSSVFDLKMKTENDYVTLHG